VLAIAGSTAGAIAGSARRAIAGSVARARGRAVARFVLFASLVAGLAGAAAAQTEEPLFTFAQISDSQPDTPEKWALFERVLDTIAAAGQPGALIPRPVDFVLFAGDLVSHAESQAEWTQFVATIDARLTATGIPYRAVPGNHDEDGFGVGNYEFYVGDSGVWDTDVATVVGHNGPSVTTGWSGLRIIGFNNSNGAWNQISAADLASIAARVAAASAAGENVFLLGHHPHNEKNVIPLAGVLEDPALCGYARGHSGRPHAYRGLEGILNPDVWDLNSNEINKDGAILYYEAFPNELRVHVIELVLGPTALPAAETIPLLHPLVPAQPRAPAAGFSAYPVSGAAPLDVSFTDRSTGSPTSWLWSFGDGATSTEKHPTHTYAAPGVYDVSLTASNALGSSTSTRASYVTVLPPPLVQTFRSVADARVHSTYPTSNYGTESTLRIRVADPTYRGYLRFAVTGLAGASVYSAKLRLFVTDSSDDGGALYQVASDWTESGITWANAPAIGGAPLATAGPVVAGQWVEFDVSSAVGGDGSYGFALVSASTNRAYFSSREGANPPELVVQTEAETLPVADFAAAPAQGTAPLSVAFTDLSTGGPTAWLWRFGDGATSSEANPVHVYAAPGVYDVTLTVWNARGGDTLVRAGHVSVIAGAATQTFLPAADARVNSGNPNANYGADGVLRVRTGTSVYRSFLRFDLSGLASLGIVSAKLRLFATDGSDDAGSVYEVASGWTESGITWSNAPAIDGAPLAAAGPVAAGQWVELDVTSAVRGDGSVSFALASASSNSVYYSSREGASPPELVVETSVLATPVADFGAAPAQGPAPLEVAFTDLSSGGPTFRVWDFGDGTTSTLRNPVHVYAAPGLYDVSLGVANSVGSDATTRPDFVRADEPPPTAVYPAAADAKVSSSKPAVNYGFVPDLRVRSGSPGSWRSFLRFEVAGLTRPVVRAVLRLYVDDGSPDGGAVYAVSSPWSEGGVTWDTAPPLDGAPLASLGAVTTGQWVEADLTALVTGNGSYALGIANASDDSAYYASREGAHPPELVIEYLE
jgi:PKD repeat protein